MSASPSTASPPLLSVVVATRNRAASLSACLRSLEESAARLGAPCEVIVVDNGSTDETAAVIAAAAGRTPVIVALTQAIPGLSRARNAGLRRARAALIAFTDDDCRVAADWMSAIVRRLGADHDVDGLGGRVELADPADAPVAIRLASEPRRIADIDAALALLIGCNFALRRTVIDRIGGFDERLGAGTAACSAEDLDLWYRMLEAGSVLYYDPSVALRHAHGRRAAGAVAALRHGYVVGRGAFLAKHGLRGDRRAWLRLIRELRARELRRALLHGFWIRLRGR